MNRNKIPLKILNIVFLFLKIYLVEHRYFHEVIVDNVLYILFVYLYIYIYIYCCCKNNQSVPTLYFPYHGTNTTNKIDISEMYKWTYIWCFTIIV